MRILVVEDERRMAERLRQGLSEDGQIVTVAVDGSGGLALAESSNFDLLILDVMLPGCTGFDIARQLRAGGDRTPILMLTACDAPRDVVSGLDLGADDYMTKPFSFEILLAHVRALGRRGPIAQPVMLQGAGITLSLGTREVRRGGKKIDLNAHRIRDSRTVDAQRGPLLTRKALIERVWGADSNIENNTLDAFVWLLRSKIESAGEPRVIRTVRGIGYGLRPEEE